MSNVFLGIDGGWSKTRGVLLDGEGRIAAEANAGGSCIGPEPGPEPCAVLSALADDLCRQSSTPRAAVTWCGIGLNGVDFDDELPAQIAGVSNCLGVPAERTTLVNDAIIALWGSTPAPAACIQQLGSGFTAAYRARHGDEKLFDHLSVGGPFDIRREAVALVARMIDGRAEPTPLKEKVMACLGIESENEFADTIFRRRQWHSPDAPIAQAVFGAVDAGDTAALDLVGRAADEYALAAHAMIETIGIEDVHVGLGGGVLAGAPDAFWSMFADRVRADHPRAAVKKPDLPPEFGAAIMAAFQAGIEPQALFRNVLAQHSPDEEDAQ